MTDTANLALPLVQASQAQKHVTVNEALARLDALTQFSVESRDMTTPPIDPVDGTAHIVPSGAGGAWTGQTGRIAIFSNGGWVFVPPRAGWRGWVRDRGARVVYDGAAWTDGAMALSANGSASVLEVIEADIAVTPGGSVTTADLIPGTSVLFGATGIVTQEITGTLASWSIGVPGASGRYGSGLGLSLGSWLQGLTGQPQAYYTPTPLLIEAEGGDFAAGSIRIALHVFRMTLPRV